MRETRRITNDTSNCICTFCEQLIEYLGGQRRGYYENLDGNEQKY